jgi:hypothetical protein
MKKGIAAGVFVLSIFASGGVEALDLAGSDRLDELVRAVLASCSNASSINYIGGGASAAESAMLNGQQLVAPMSRFMGAGICSARRPDLAAGLTVALDATVLMGGANTAGLCGGLRFSGSVTAGAETYTLSNWRDILRVLFAGVHHDGSVDCNSAVRRALADDWASNFAGTCTGQPCSRIHRLFRSSDASEVTELFLSMLSLPSTSTNPLVFCNGTEKEDKDPVRRPCSDAEQVCGKGGDLGLVLPIISTKVLAPTEAFPTTPCTGRMTFAMAPSIDGVVGRCPNGDIPVFGNSCLVPTDVNGNPVCLSRKATHPAFIFDDTPIDGVRPSRADGRVYNLHLHKPDGTYLRDPRDSQLISHAFYRIHSKPGATATACLEPSEHRQIGCLAQASPCSIGFGGHEAAAAPGAAALDVNGIAPTADNIRQLFTQTGPAWPFSRPIYLNSVAGFVAVGNEPVQRAFDTCFSDPAVIEPAALALGFVPLGGPPICQDFDEHAICGAAHNRQACGVTFNFCPTIDTYEISPLDTRVGGVITLMSTASDEDDGPLPLAYTWSATSGTIAAPSSPNTTFTCTVPGPVTLTLTVTDDDCSDTISVDVECLAP